MINLTHMLRGLPENIRHYLTHMGIVNGEQDYINKKFILDGMCSGSKGKGCEVIAIRALDYIQKYGGK